MGWGDFELGNAKGRGGGSQTVLEIQVEVGGGGKKLCLPVGGCGFFLE